MLAQLPMSDFAARRLMQLSVCMEKVRENSASLLQSPLNAAARICTRCVLFCLVLVGAFFCVCVCSKITNMPATSCTADATHH